jgi:ribosomal protein L13
MSKTIDMAGSRFGRLYVVCRAGSFTGGKASWQCECDCGRDIVVTGAHLREGNTVSCGCKRDESQYGKF